jgi:hypothetical protein
MKKRDKTEDRLMKDLFSHHEVSVPSASFEERVMYRVSVEKKYNPEIYRPVINRTGWIIICIVALVLVFLSVYLSNDGVGYLDRLFSLKINFNYPGIELTGIMRRIEEIFSSMSSIVLYVIAGLLGMTVVMIGEQLLQRLTLPKK